MQIVFGVKSFAISSKTCAFFDVTKKRKNAVLFWPNTTCVGVAVADHVSIKLTQICGLQSVAVCDRLF